MQITIYGANGRVGTIVTQLALEKGYRVVAFVHGKITFENPKLKILQGDIYNPQSVADAMTDSEAVLSTLGSWGTPNKDIVSTGAQHIIPAMKSRGLSRIVTLTGADAEAPNEAHGLIHNGIRPLLKLIAPKILADGEKHLQLLSESGLDWTTLRSPVMNQRGSPNAYKLTTKEIKPWQTIHRRSVATAMIEVLETTEWSGQAPPSSHDLR